MRGIRINYNPTNDISDRCYILERVVDKYNLLRIAPDDTKKEECLLLLPLNKEINLQELEKELYLLKILFY